MSHAQRQGPTYTHTHKHTSWPSLWETACALGGEHGPGSSVFGDKEGMFKEGLVGERQSMIGDVAPCAPPTHLRPTSFFFHLYFSTRLFLWSDTRLRPHTPTPSATTELSTNLTAWSDVSRSRITTYYELSRAQCSPNTHTHTHPPATPALHATHP